MWYKSSNSDAAKPSALDTEISRKWNYIRKDFQKIEATEKYPEHWEWLEMKISKSDWNIYMQVMDQDSALNDVYNALTELAEMIAGGQ